jgi:cell shape-determining protein MreC
MTRLLQTDRVLLITTLVVLLLSIAPTRWLVPWTADLGSIIQLPLTPLGHAASGVVAYVRPTPTEAVPSLSELARIIEERDAFRGRWHAARLQVEQLEKELTQVQGARSAFGVSSDWTPRNAVVVRHAPGGVSGPLQLNVGSRQGVLPGTVAVVDGDQLVGRIADDVSLLSSTLIPIGITSDPTSRDLLARITPADDPTIGADVGESIRLKSIGGGRFEGLIAWDTRKGDAVTLGDQVRLARDRAWQPTAWGMLIGTVAEIQSTDENPLRKRIIVETLLYPERLPTVTLKLQAPSNASTDVRTAVEAEGTP